MFPEELLQTIAQEKATLKIITKTKNERLFIEKWIKHHLAIIGDGKLIIFDNMSDDQHVLDVYEKYKEHILLIKFNAYFDDVHNYFRVKYFYDVIGKSCDFFTVLDSDEFLYFYGENNTAIHDTTILDYLKENKDCDFFAPCWLENIEGKESILNLNSEIHAIKNKAELIELFDWGKAIINSNILNNLAQKSSDNVIFQHTLYLPTLEYKKAPTKFFIAHLKNLDIQQRITTNMNKLVNNRVLSKNTDFEELLKIKKTTYNHTVDSYIQQTQRLVKGHRANPLIPINISPEKLMEIGDDGTLHFSSTFTEKAFSKLLNSNYLDLIHYDYSKASNGKYRRLRDWIGKYA